MAARRLSGTRGRTPTTRRRKRAVYGRLSVGKGFVSFCSCWLVRPCIRPVGAAFHVPLAITPFARFRSRSKARTYSARPQWVFLIRRFQLALCISSCAPFPTSSAIACPVYPMRCPVLCSARRRSSMPRPCGLSCWPAQPPRPWLFAAPSVAPAMAAWSRSVRHSG